MERDRIQENRVAQRVEYEKCLQAAKALKLFSGARKFIDVLKGFRNVKVHAPHLSSLKPQLALSSSPTTFAALALNSSTAFIISLTAEASSFTLQPLSLQA